MTSVDKLIGQRLAHARLQSGLTLRELAARLGWDHSTLSSYETGRRSLNIARLIAVAQELGRSPASFLVTTPEAAIIVDQIDGNIERCLQIGIVLESLEHGDEPPPEDEAAPAYDEGRSQE
jgi:transcriptional regulator with XRE-family HTH domain